MEAPTAAKMEAGVRARARRLLGVVVWPLPPLRLGEAVGNYKSRRAGRGGWWRGPLCEAGRARGRGAGPTLTLDPIVSWPSPLWGTDYRYQSAVRQWRLLCVWTETPLHLSA